ncbi:MAG: hypothetical protein GXX84_11085 [Acidobacteria bacterium]|nr:hypothetical protein [Acidobacteriota bacterium]
MNKVKLLAFALIIVLAGAFYMMASLSSPAAADTAVSAGDCCAPQAECCQPGAACCAGQQAQGNASCESGCCAGECACGECGCAVSTKA